MTQHYLVYLAICGVCACGGPQRSQRLEDTDAASGDSSVGDEPEALPIDAALAADVTPSGQDASGDGSLFCQQDCDDGDPCTDDVCYRIVGCSHVPRAGSCDDGNPCTISDVCGTNGCAGKANPCADNDPCTLDSCVLPTGCTHTAQGC